MLLIVVVLPIAFFALVMGLARIERWANLELGMDPDVAVPRAAVAGAADGPVGPAQSLR